MGKQTRKQSPSPSISYIPGLIMRVLRVLKRTLVVLLFVCMTLKIQLELRVLRAGRNIGGYSPWWGNETLGHLRAFPKLATRANVSLGDLRSTSIADRSLISNKTSDVLASSVYRAALKASSGNLTRVPLQQAKNSDPNTSYRKILSDATNRNNPVVASSSGTVSRTSRGIELNVTAPKFHSNHYTRGDMFAKLRIYDGENTIDTDTIYYSHKRANTSENTDKGSNKSSSQSNGKAETATSANKKQVPIIQTVKTPNATKKLRRSLVPMPKVGTASSFLRKKVKLISKEVSHDVDKNEMSLTKEAIADIKEQLRQENERQTVYNQESFGPVLENTTIFLVQVSSSLIPQHTFSVVMFGRSANFWVNKNFIQVDAYYTCDLYNIDTNRDHKLRKNVLKGENKGKDRCNTIFLS